MRIIFISAYDNIICEKTLETFFHSILSWLTSQWPPQYRCLGCSVHQRVRRFFSVFVAGHCVPYRNLCDGTRCWNRSSWSRSTSGLPLSPVYNRLKTHWVCRLRQSKTYRLLQNSCGKSMYPHLKLFLSCDYWIYLIYNECWNKLCNTSQRWNMATLVTSSKKRTRVRHIVWCGKTNRKWHFISDRTSQTCVIIIILVVGLWYCRWGYGRNHPAIILHSVPLRDRM